MKPPTVRIAARLIIENDHDCNCEYCVEGGDDYLDVVRSGWVARCCSRSSGTVERSEAVVWLADHLHDEHGMKPRTVLVHEAIVCPACEGTSGAPKNWEGDRKTCAECEGGIVWKVERSVDVDEARRQAASIAARRDRQAKAS